MTSIPLPHRVGPRLPIPEVPIHSLFVSMINATISQDPERIAIVSCLPKKSFIHHVLDTL
jgi:hypothetical protein